LKNKRLQADLALGTVALVWGTTFVVVKAALSQISAMYFLTLRFSLASVCMLLLFVRPFLRYGGRAVWRGLRGGAIAGMFLWLGYTLQTFGLELTTAANSGFLTGLYIVLVPLIAAAVYRRWPRKAELTGVAIASVGMALLTLHPGDQAVRLNRGDALTIGSAVAFAIHLLVLGYYSQRERFEAVALGQIVCTAILCSASLLVQPPTVLWGPGVLFAIALTGIFATALAFALQTWGQQYTTPTRTALIFALEPVFSLGTAVSLGGETFTWMSLIGGSLVIAGIVAVELKPASTT
jgi:drug/metabolite transporter (DMT)-like permease